MRKAMHGTAPKRAVAIVFGSAALMASPGAFFNNAAPIPSAFTMR
jgi:hypothetical protein